MGCVSPTDHKKEQLLHKNGAVATQNKNISAPPNLSNVQSGINKGQVYQSNHKQHPATNEQTYLLHESGGRPFKIEPKPVIDPQHENQWIKQTASKYLDNENVQESLIHANEAIGDLQHQKSPSKIEDINRGAGSSSSLNIQLNLNSRDLSKEKEQRGSNYESGIKEVDKYLEHSNGEHKSSNIIRNIESHLDLNQSYGRSAIQVSRQGSPKRQTYTNQNISGQPQIEEMLNEQYLEQANFFFKLPEIRLVF